MVTQDLTSCIHDDYLCVAGLAVLFESTGGDVQVFITLQTLPVSDSLTDAALSQSCKKNTVTKENVHENKVQHF